MGFKQTSTSVQNLGEYPSRRRPLYDSFHVLQRKGPIYTDLSAIARIAHKCVRIWERCALSDWQ
jgi:hypothetical protein